MSQDRIGIGAVGVCPAGVLQDVFDRFPLWEPEFRGRASKLVFGSVMCRSANLAGAGSGTGRQEIRPTQRMQSEPIELGG